MKKVIWITLFATLVAVNGLAVMAAVVWDVYIAVPYRLVVALAISFVTIVFVGAWMLVKGAENEKR